MKESAELRSMSKEELETELLALRKAQFNQRLKKASGALDQVHMIKNVRRAIARVKTIMTEKVG